MTTEGEEYWRGKICNGRNERRMGYERRMEAGKSNSKKKMRDGRVEEEDQTKKRKIWGTREKVRG